MSLYILDSFPQRSSLLRQLAISQILLTRIDFSAKCWHIQICFDRAFLLSSSWFGKCVVSIHHPLISSNLMVFEQVKIDHVCTLEPGLWLTLNTIQYVPAPASEEFLSPVLVGRQSHTQISQTFHHTIALFISLPIHPFCSPGRSLICLSVSGMPHKKSIKTCRLLIYMATFATLEIIAVWMLIRKK